MTKISYISKKTPPVDPAPAGKSQNDLFQTTLNRTLECKPATDCSNLKCVHLEEIQPIHHGFDNITDQETTVFCMADHLLDLLDQYSGTIQDPCKTLKEAEPVLKTIRAHADALRKETQFLEPGSTLRIIADQCSLTAHIECFKFDRGDYI